ncbi:hypothetical protein LWI29_027549 [Acer saccharum]|uniref:Uncharacterized protein n=1 Tax=Acer saccharum TaxID=4024 RepID=A0AA39ST86_ACESA|nr:hypothetical protein LWI29_027549 [Acer saccharum]
MTRIAKQEVLPRVGMTRIGKQEVMARVGRTRIVMHGRLPRGKSALDRELANILVGLGVWLDIDSDRAGYTGCCSETSAHALECAWFCAKTAYGDALGISLVFTSVGDQRPGRRMKPPFYFGD